MKPYYEHAGITIYHGDVLATLRDLPEESVHCVVTSPPYWGLRDYGVEGQIGLEKTPQEYVAKIVEVFREVRRVLRKDGTCWVNLGDSYGSGTRATRQVSQTSKHGYWENPAIDTRIPSPAKQLCGIPWRVAFALQEAGWYLRQDIIWAKPNPMPESVRDRCTKAHEYLFLLTKSAKYYYDAEAIKEDCTRGDAGSSYRDGKTGTHQLGRASDKPRKTKVPGGWDTGSGSHGTIHRDGRTEAEYVDVSLDGKRNKRSVWQIATQPYSEAHFATFPEKLVEPCILAGCPSGGTVLDPFTGSGTTLLVAGNLNCKSIGIELNADYIQIAAKRLAQEVMEFGNAVPNASRPPAAARPPCAAAIQPSPPALSPSPGASPADCSARCRSRPRPPRASSPPAP